VKLSKRRGKNPLKNPAVNLGSPPAQDHSPGSLDAELRAALAELSSQGLLRRLRSTSGLLGPRMSVDGRDVLMLAGANYLDLAGDARVIAAANDATQRYGTAAGGARLISGNLAVHEEVEAALAAFAGSEAALLFSTGYMANLGLVTALAGPDDAIVSDALNHASTIDAARLSRAAVHVFRHNDPDDLARVASSLGAARRRLLVLDGVYSMDGDVARLEELVTIGRAHDMVTLLDDAHGFGVLGEGGRGVAELAGVEVDFLVANLGKALGSFGAVVCCSAIAREYLLNTARSFIFTCGIAPGPAAAAGEALALLRKEPQRRATLLARAEQLRRGLRQAGYDTGASTTHIIPAIVGQNDTVMDLCERALARGVYVQGIRYPSVAEGTARLRFTPTSAHSEEDIQTVVDLFTELR
jgi:8-amino-7-oxononanoate synthase